MLLEHLPFALGQRCEALRDVPALCAARDAAPVGGQGLVNCRDQLGVVHRLGQEVRRAVFHRLHAGRDVASAGEKDDRQRAGLLLELSLQLQPVQAGHCQVEHQAARRIAVVSPRSQGLIQRGLRA